MADRATRFGSLTATSCSPRSDSRRCTRNCRSPALSWTRRERRSNGASNRIIGWCVAEEDLRRLSSGGYLNFIRLMFDPQGMRPHVQSWDATATYLVGRLRREYSSDPGSLAALLLRLRLFNTLTTFGTPQDVSLQGIRVEMSFPMDAESDALLRQLERNSG